MDESLRLSPGEMASPVWQKIRSFYVQRLAELRAQNDNPFLQEGETAALRGQIREVKRLLAVETPPPVIEP